ncbi:hypothetical protein ABIB25_003057 [Nakamurella sp. UYEF19]
MKPQCFVDLGHDGCPQQSERRSQPLNRDGADLFGLGFGCNAQSGAIGGDEYLKRKHSTGVAGQWHHGATRKYFPDANG